MAQRYKERAFPGTVYDYLPGEQMKLFPEKM
jgi:hypothetical protein